LTPLVIATTWWLLNGVLVGPMVAFSQGRPGAEGVWQLWTSNIWLHAQETGLVLFGVLAWRSNPILLGVVALLIIGQGMTSRRLQVEFEETAVAREEAQSEHRRAEAEARSARLDPLTQLANRHALDEALDALPPRPAVVMLDLDHFKMINDRYGHDTGDAVLVEVARVLRVALRPGDFCARMGGEEFCLLLADIGSHEELLVATERLRQSLEKVRPAGFPMVTVTASIGALRVPDGLPVAEALRLADQATYRAKAKGRNRVELVC
jgi:diguanylate cyclase (GGDEF)-like protein